MGIKYVIRNHEIPHFVTFSVIQWVDALTREEYKEIIIESLTYCKKEKGLMLYAYVIMSNHVHLIISAREGYNLSNILRDLKRHTSKEILKAISSNPQESKKSWMLWIFKSAGKKNSNNEKFQFWKQDNHPIELDSNFLIVQKLNYLHDNPVKEGLVNNPEEYKYSSASNYCDKGGLIEVNVLD